MALKSLMNWENPVSHINKNIRNITDKGDENNYEKTELISIILKAKHLNATLRSKAVKTIGEHASKFNDDIAFVLLAKTEEIENAEELIRLYKKLTPYLKDLHLERYTKENSQDYRRIKKWYDEFIVNDPVFMVIRYNALKYLYESINNSNNIDSMEINELKGFVIKEASKLLEEWDSNEMFVAIKEILKI
jgi:hypothetical protein